MPSDALYAKHPTLNRLRNDSKKQIPRGLKPARDDNNKRLSGTAEAVPFQSTASECEFLVANTTLEYAGRIAYHERLPCKLP